MTDTPFQLKTVVSRDRLTATAGELHVETFPADEQVILGNGDDRDVTYVTLTPAEATAAATALKRAAAQMESEPEPPTTEDAADA